MLWRFPHPDTGWPCMAKWDGVVLTVQADKPVRMGSRAQIDAYYAADDDLAECTAQRLYCATADAARRELRAIGVDAAYLS